MYKENEQDIYYAHKQFMFIIFETKNETYKKMPYLYNIDVFKLFYRFLKDFSSQCNISNVVKKNLYEILNYGKSIKDENTSERNSLINEMIILINTTSSDTLDFYAQQLYYRRPKVKLTVDNIEDSMDSINESIVNDFVVLTSHSEDIDDDNFVENYLPTLVFSDEYYESLNVIFKACPSLFRNKVFMDRVKAVVSLKFSNDRDAKTLKKVIKKYRL